jgi:hypothetical protein
MTRRVDRIPVTEADLREQIRDLCKLFGWKMYFSWTSIHSPRGFPDLVLVNPELKRTIFAELKDDKKQPTPEQLEWLEALEAAGQAVFLWRPRDIETIAKVLSPQPVDELLYRGW